MRTWVGVGERCWTGEISEHCRKGWLEQEKRIISFSHQMKSGGVLLSSGFLEKVVHAYSFWILTTTPLPHPHSPLNTVTVRLLSPPCHWSSSCQEHSWSPLCEIRGQFSFPFSLDLSATFKAGLDSYLLASRTFFLQSASTCFSSTSKSLMLVAPYFPHLHIRRCQL